MTLSLSSLLSRKQQAAAPAQQQAAAPDLDSAAQQAWGITPSAWAGMTDQQRVWHRWNVTKAPNFGK